MALKTMGLRVRKTTDYREGYDFMVEDKVRIAVRYAIPTSDRQQVYKKRNGELSHYSYKRWTFNFHRHGKRPERYCDFFVCFLGAPSSGGADASDATDGGAASLMNGADESTNVTVFVIPWEAITGLTFCSSMREGSTRPYRGKYAIYRDAWNLIGERGLEGRPAPLHAERKRLSISADSRRRLQLVVGPAGAGAPAEERAPATATASTSGNGAREAGQSSSSAENGAAPAEPAPLHSPARVRLHID